MRRINASASRLVFLTAPLLLAVSVLPVSAATKDAPGTPTFHRDVQPILQNSCQGCHRDNGANLGGMVAPMPLLDYDDARPWAKSIARQVKARTMPPWHASKDQNGVFSNQRTLRDEEIETLVRWAENGAPRGDIGDAPPPKEWPETTDGWITGTPDLEISIGEPYFVADDVEDLYVNFVTEITPEMLPAPRWVKSIEFQPGSSIVHHIVAPPLGGLGPGLQPYVYPENFGTLLMPGDQVRWSMHYHKESGPDTGVWDLSRANIQFYPEGTVPEHAVSWQSAIRADFLLPAGEPHVEYTQRVAFERDTLLLALNPHMHLRGKAARYTAFYPDGSSEVLLDVPQYDFNWQTTYEYPHGQAKRLPAGTEIEYLAAWDNSAGNPDNPDPTRDVTWGEPTTDEMMVGWIIASDAEPGVEMPGGGLTSRARVRESSRE